MASHTSMLRNVRSVASMRASSRPVSGGAWDEAATAFFRRRVPSHKKNVRLTGGRAGGSQNQCTPPHVKTARYMHGPSRRAVMLRRSTLHPSRPHPLFLFFSHRLLRPIATGLKSSILAGAAPRAPRPLPPPRRPATRRRTAAGVVSSGRRSEDGGVGGVRGSLVSSSVARAMRATARR